MDHSRSGLDIASVLDILFETNVKRVIISENTSTTKLAPAHEWGPLAPPENDAMILEDITDSESLRPSMIISAHNGSRDQPDVIMDSESDIMSSVLIVDSAKAASDDDVDQALLDSINASMQTGPDSIDTEAPAILVSQYGTNEILVCGFPHLFPFGLGVPESNTDPNYTRYLMIHHSNAFAAESRLYFFHINALKKQGNARSTSLRIQAHKLHVEAVSSITRHHDFRARLAGVNANPKSDDAKALLSSLLLHIPPLGVNTPYRARSAVGKAQGLVSQGSGFDPDLFHKACCMPFTCRWRFEIKLGI